MYLRNKKKKKNYNPNLKKKKKFGNIVILGNDVKKVNLHTNKKENVPSVSWDRREEKKKKNKM